MAKQDEEPDSYLFGDDKPVFGATADIPLGQPMAKPVKPGKSALMEEDPFMKQFKASQSGVYSGLAGSEAAAGLGVKYAREAFPSLEKSKQSALGQLGAESGRQQAMYLAQGGGGSTAGSREAGLARARQQGNVEAQFGDLQNVAKQRLADALAKEAQVKTDRATTEQKLKQAEADRAKAQVEEQTGVEKDIREAFHTAVDNEAWWSDEDAKMLAKNIRDKYMNWPNPTVKARAMQMANEIENKAGEFEE